MSTLPAMTRWGIIGCGDVTEVKSGPAFQKATGSALVAVMRRDLSKAQDYARRPLPERGRDRVAVGRRSRFASIIPARRAASVDPIVALRAE